MTRNEATIMRTRLCIQPVVPQLAHSRVDHRVAGLPLLPGFERATVAAPPKFRKRRIERNGNDLRKMVEEVIGKLSPDELPQIGFARPGASRYRFFVSRIARGPCADTRCGPSSPQCKIRADSRSSFDVRPVPRLRDSPRASGERNP